MTAITVDARGHRCPTPTLRLARALEGAAPGDLVRLIADDPLARIDVPHYAATKGHEVVSVESDGGRLIFTLRKGAQAHSS
jgi:tRNA 2-thiouridine synthesizing protein A